MAPEQETKEKPELIYRSREKPQKEGGSRLQIGLFTSRDQADITVFITLFTDVKLHSC